MRWFIRRAQAVGTICRNAFHRVSKAASLVWSRLTLANLKRTPRFLLNGFLWIVFGAWSLLCSCMRFVRRTFTFTNMKKAFLGSPRFALNIVLFMLGCVRSVGGDTLKYGKRNWTALALMAFSFVLLGIGCLRLYDYNVPMLKNDYQQAGKGKTEYDFADKDDAPQPAMFENPDFTQRTVTAVIHAAGASTDLVVGDRVTAKFNNAYRLYQETRYEEAIKAFNNAYRAMSDKDGQVKKGYEKLAAETQFMIGNAFCNSGKDGEAINAYQLSLTYDPNNIVTIYNLERLLSNGGGGGGDKGDKPKPSNPNKTKV